MGGLQVNLDSPLPADVPIGAGTALFVAGTCFDAERRITRLTLLVDGESQPVLAHGMPRLDYFRVLHPAAGSQSDSVALDSPSAEDPRRHSYRSGFWGLAVIRGAPPSGYVELLLRASFDSGPDATEPLGRIAVAHRPEPIHVEPPPAEGPLVAICLATYNPPLGLLARQLDSIRAQTHSNWVCLISDDCSRPDRFEAIQELVAGDRRFVVSPIAEAAWLLSEFRAGAGAGPAHGLADRALRPGRLLVPGKAGDTDRRSERRPARVQRRPDRR